MVPDSFACSLQEPDTEDFGWPQDYLLALPDQEKSSVTTPRRRPLHESEKGVGSLSPSSLEEGPPKTSSAEKDGDPNYKVKTSVILRSKIGMSHITKLPFFLLTARWRADSLGEIVRPGLSQAQDPPVKISSPALRPWPPGLRKRSSSPPGRRDSRFPPY